jgi:hypothetical protein
MKRLLAFASIFLAAAALDAATPDATPAATPAPAADNSGAGPRARASVLDLAGAFSNDGYKIRDGFYFGELDPKKGAVIEVNLYAGNEYWFCAAANDPVRKIVVQVFDEKGKPVEQQHFDDGARAAAGVVAGTSGKYLVKVSPVEGGPGSFCFLYCYK